MLLPVLSSTFINPLSDLRRCSSFSVICCLTSNLGIPLPLPAGVHRFCPEPASADSASRSGSAQLLWLLRRCSNILPPSPLTQRHWQAYEPARHRSVHR